MAKALSPALWKQKQCTLQNILETLESHLFSALSHLHSMKDLEQKVKISNPYKLHLKSWEQLKCSCGCRVGAFPPTHVAEVLVLRPQVINHQDLFSCQYIQKETPKPNNGVLNKKKGKFFFFEAGANIVHWGVLFTVVSSTNLIQYS